MAATGAGRYCDRCEKNIVDLTDKSDAELIQFFKRKKDNVCGRLLSSQLNRKLIVPPAKKNWHWLMPLAIGAIAITPVQAQQLKPVVVNNSSPDKLAPQDEFKLPELNQKITVHVVDSLTGKPLSGVRLRQKNFQNVLAVSDSSGKMEIILQDVNNAVPFVLDLNGQSVAELFLKDNMVIKVKQPVVIRLGGVVAGTRINVPLYVVSSGKKSCEIAPSRMDDFNPAWIEKLEVLTNAKATALYGAKGANGVILIQIKKEYARKFNFSGKK